MRARIGLMCVAVGLLSLLVVLLAHADEPIFVRWLVVDDPGDETIRNYWERAERGELDAPALVDLGTMLFYRGWPKDAVQMFHQALDLDPKLYEAWFRIGLVKHSEGELSDARQAYNRCLKIISGHGWCNFYLGLLEEQEGHSTAALDHFRRAFKSAPELSDPKVNPEMMASELAFAAKLREYHRINFKNSMPMPYMEAGEVKKVRKFYESPPPPKRSSKGAEEAAEEAAEDSTEAEADDVAEEMVEETVEDQESPPPTPAPAESSVESQTPPQARPAPVRRAPSSSSGGAASKSGAASASAPPDPSGATSAPTSQGGGPPLRAPAIGSTSPEARLEVAWPVLWDIAAALV